MFDEKKLGQKSGQGYYKYSDDKYERVALSEELAEKMQSNSTSCQHSKQCSMARYKWCKRHRRD